MAESNVEYTSPTFTRGVRGAHFDVLEALENITFVEGTNGGMSSEIAYIRYWRKEGATKKTEVKVLEGRFLGDGSPLPEFTQEVWNTPLTGVQYNPSLQWDADFTTVNNGWNIPGYDGPYGSIPAAEIQPTSSNIPPVPPSSRFTPLRGTQSVPENTYKVKLPQVVEYARATPVQRILFGRAFSANPSGSTLTAEPASAPEGEGIWQFLFNPEELQLESGPDYNRAETWGVSDAENSGQPLSWRNNKNRKLIFSKVILHGYTFGKRVEQLEKGLQDLFMAREGTDGPPVLEFVWGRRIFGPCVIQNIRVREQAWDKGVLVNAEVSFELEQVPEWTINDGAVDIARPGNQPLVNDPTLPSRAEMESGTSGGGGSETTKKEEEKEEKEPKNKPGGGGGSLATDNTGSYRACQKAFEFVEIFKQVEYIPISTVGPISLQSDYVTNVRNQLSRIKTNFERAYSQAVSSVGPNFTKRVPGDYRPPAIQTRFSAENVNQMSSTSAEKTYIQYIKLYKKAAKICSDAMSNVWNKDCTSLIEAGKKAQTAAKNANEREYLCANVQNNKRCTIPVGNTTKNPCNGKYYLCQANGKYKSI